MIATKNIIHLITKYSASSKIISTFSTDKVPETLEEKQKMKKPYMVAASPVE